MIKYLQKLFMNIKGQIEYKRNQLQALQQQLSLDRMNIHFTVQEKIFYEELINLNDMEDQMLRQRAKAEWIRKRQ